MKLVVAFVVIATSASSPAESTATLAGDSSEDTSARSPGERVAAYTRTSSCRAARGHQGSAGRRRPHVPVRKSVDVVRMYKRGAARLAEKQRNVFSRRWARAGDLNFQRRWSMGGMHGGSAIAIEGRCLLYAIIWKGANNAIDESLFANGSGNYYGTASPRIKRKDIARLEAIRSGPQCTRGATTFTFVREPLGHFLSGFTEWTYQAYPNKTIDQQFANETLAKILSGWWPTPKRGAQHMFPMSGILAPVDTKPGGPMIGTDGWHLQWIGRLEHAQRDWSSLMRSASRMPQLRDVPLLPDRHPTSSDPHGARAAMAAVLRGNASMRKRLCALLAADYACFGYDINACHDGRVLSKFFRPS